MDFPVLSAQPVLPIRGGYRDGTIKSQPEDGALKTRQRFTAPARRTWGVQYLGMSAADFGAWETFYRSTAKQGAEIFDWRVPGRNLLQYPDDLANAVWVKDAVGVAAPVVTADFAVIGGETFDKISFNAQLDGQGQRVWQLTNPLVSAAGKTFTVAFDYANPGVAAFDLTVYFVDGGFVSITAKTFTVAPGGGVVRGTYTKTFPATAGSGLYVFYQLSDANIARVLYVARTQLEAGPIATPYLDSRQLVPVRFASVPQWQDRFVGNAIAYDVSFELEEA